jgi:antitoxin YefM
MQAVSLNHAKHDLESVIARVLADAEPIVVNMPTGEAVVVVPLDDFESWRETIYLMRTPANAEHLRKSVAEAESGSFHPHELVE